jgi:hypothetical protein
MENGKTESKMHRQEGCIFIAWVLGRSEISEWLARQVVPVPCHCQPGGKDLWGRYDNNKIPELMLSEIICKPIYSFSDSNPLETI